MQKKFDIAQSKSHAAHVIAEGQHAITPALELTCILAKYDYDL